MGNEQNFSEQIAHLEYSKNVVHPYSEGVGRILDLEMHYVSDLEKEGLAGRNVVWSDGLSEAPLFYACDTVPLSLDEMGRLAGSHAYQAAEDAWQLPRETCSMIKLMLGEYYLRQGKTINRILYRASTCEPFSIAAELLSRCGYEVEDAALWLNGKPLDKEKLRSELKKYNQAIRKVRTIMNLRRRHNTYVKSLPAMFIILGSTHYFGRFDAYMEALDLIIEEMSLLGEGEYNEDLVRLVWSGGRGMEFGVYDAVDRAGAAIMGWSIMNTYEVGFDEEKDPLDAFVEYQIGEKTGGSVEDRYTSVERQLKVADADGIIQYGYIGCSLGGIMTELQRDHFKKMGVPFLSLEGSFQVGEASGQVETRVKAFIEMLS